MRPEIDDDVVEAVDELVDRHTRVPVKHLTFNQRVEVLVAIADELEEKASGGHIAGGSPGGFSG